MLISLHTLIILLCIIAAFWLWKSHRRTSVLVIIATVVFALPLIAQIFPALGHDFSIRQVFTDFVGTCLLLVAVVAKK